MKVFFFQDGLIVENMHDVPYSFTVGPEVCTCMTAVCSAVRNVCPNRPLGVQILSSANQQALAVALASGSTIHQLIFKSLSHAGQIQSSVRNCMFLSQINALTCSLALTLWCVYVFRSGFHQGRGFCLFSCGGWGFSECLRWGPFEISQADWSWWRADLYRYQKEAQVRLPSVPFNLLVESARYAPHCKMLLPFKCETCSFVHLPFTRTPLS